MLIALTGGIGSGKSTVARMLETRGAVVIDADQLARAVVEPGAPALGALVERFGSAILLPDGRLDRRALARIVFADDSARRDLEAITHPAIGDELERCLETIPPGSIVVYDVPLLGESSRHARGGFDAVVVVETPLETRLARLERRGMAREEAERRVASQPTDDERRPLATHVVRNGGDLGTLEAQVEALWADLTGAPAGE